MSESTPTVYCSNHPQTETALRCNNCEKPICAKCAVQTPTGYRCPECVRGQQKAFETAEWQDYPAIFLIVLGLSFVGSIVIYIIGNLGWFGFITLLVSPSIAGLLSEIGRRIVRNRRSKKLFQAAAAAALIGSLPLLLFTLIRLLGGFGSLFAILPLVWQAFYTFSVTTTVYYRLKGIRI
jgi:hypothetical protein